MDFSCTAHATATIEAKGFDLEAVEAVWADPEMSYPSHRYPTQHKRIGRGIVLCCDNESGRVITVFINQTETELRPDQTDSDAIAWAMGKVVRHGTHR